MNEYKEIRDLVLFVIVMAIIGTVTSGCGVMGVRRFSMWDGGPRWDFAEGFDLHAGANSIDTVSDSRGVNSLYSYEQDTQPIRRAK